MSAVCSEVRAASIWVVTRMDADAAGAAQPRLLTPEQVA
jgi:hypothetical protein